MWVTEFPLFEYSEEDGRYYAMHHPFTAPMDEDYPFIESNPGKVRARAYDIVLNGTEIGGGSVRIHTTEMQQKMFNVLGISEKSAEEKFGFLLEAFKYGVPPHAGLAYGLDRLVTLLLGLEDIREVIAFPKVQNASELMSKCPSYASEDDLKELGIAVIDKEDTPKCDYTDDPKTNTCRNIVTISEILYGTGTTTNLVSNTIPLSFGEHYDSKLIREQCLQSALQSEGGTQCTSTNTNCLRGWKKTTTSN